jgi:hypothetical protein
MYSLGAPSRHSDAATEVVIDLKNSFMDLLRKYGYDGAKYPGKEYILTETNIPSKAVGDNIGSAAAQRNFLVKTAIVGQQNQLSGIYVFGVWDDVETYQNGSEYEYMGLFKPIPETPSGSVRINDSGIAWRTASRRLANRKYDAAATARLSLPSDIAGGAFYSQASKDFIYVLWAKTTRDRNETASATYTFPSSFNVKSVRVISWDEKETTTNGNKVALTGSPVFINVQ